MDFQRWGEGTRELRRMPYKPQEQTRSSINQVGFQQMFLRAFSDIQVFSCRLVSRPWPNSPRCRLWQASRPPGGKVWRTTSSSCGEIWRPTKIWASRPPTPAVWPPGPSVESPTTVWIAAARGRGGGGVGGRGRWRGRWCNSFLRKSSSAVKLSKPRFLDSQRVNFQMWTAFSILFCFQQSKLQTTAQFPQKWSLWPCDISTTRGDFTMQPSAGQLLLWLKPRLLPNHPGFAREGQKRNFTFTA